MKIYLAAVYHGGRSSNGTSANLAVTADHIVPHVLESFFYLRGSRLPDIIRRNNQTIFLDSGAFSMFTQGVDISIDEYAQFIHDEADIIHVASNLDDITKTPQLSYDNQKTLEGLGCDVKPVFHCREDPKWLVKYLDEGYDYIFLGGMVPETTKWLRGWLDDLWHKYLVKDDGTSRVKIHGFGLTTVDLMFRYPWYSVDSTSWVMASRMGKIFVDLPHKIQGMVMSDKSPKLKERDQHYKTMSPALRAGIDKRIEELGYKVDDLCQMYGWRDKWNMQFFERIQSRGVDKFEDQEMGLF